MSGPAGRANGPAGRANGPAGRANGPYALSEVPAGLADAAAVHAAHRPSGLALVEGDRCLTWSALDRAVEAAAGALVRAGVAPGDRVAVLAGPSARAIVALHAIARAGAVAAPLGTRLTTGELGTAAAILRPVLALHDGTGAARLAALGAPAMTLAGLDRDVPPRPAPSPSATESAPGPGGVAILTSGTTGRPKVALLPAYALAASARSWTAGLPQAGGWLLCLGLAHVAGIGVAWRAALDGIPLVVLHDAEPTAIRHALTTDPFPTHVSLVPTQLHRLLDATAAPAGDVPAPPTVRALLLGGGSIPPGLVTRALRAGWPVVPTYGMTETGSGATALPTAEAIEHPESAGRPLPGVELRIDAPGRDGVGEIVVRTPSRFAGYLGDPDATAAVVDAEGWLRTGDLGRFDPAGRLVVVDRRTDLVVSGGENVAPAEVEAVLAAHPVVAEAGVVDRPDATWGAVPVAAIVLRPGAVDPGDAALRAFCRERLASYKVPAAFVRVDALPRTASGKLRRAALRDRIAAMHPDGGSPGGAGAGSGGT